MINKKHHYFVSYNYTDQYDANGFGNATIATTYRIDTIEGLNEVKYHIMAKRDLKELIILNWKDIKG